MNMKKKVWLFVAALGLMGVFGSSVKAYQFGSGSMNTDEERNRIVIQVYNADTVAHEDGDVAVWNDGSIQDGVEVTTTTTANNGLVAGVFLGDCPAATWCTLLTHGYHDSVTIAVANSARDALVTSTTGEAAGVYSVAQATGTASGEATSFGVFATALEATTSSTTVKAFIHR